MSDIRILKTTHYPCAVRVRGDQAVHAFKAWADGERTLVTWCGLDADLAQGAVKTTETITCRGCSQASWQDTQRWTREIRWHIPRGVTR